MFKNTQTSHARFAYVCLCVKKEEMLKMQKVGLIFLIHRNCSSSELHVGSLKLKEHSIAIHSISVAGYCISCYFREGFIFANFASQTLAKISTSIHVYL